MATTKRIRYIKNQDYPHRKYSRQVFVLPDNTQVKVIIDTKKKIYLIFDVQYGETNGILHKGGPYENLNVLQSQARRHLERLGGQLSFEPRIKRRGVRVGGPKPKQVTENVEIKND